VSDNDLRPEVVAALSEPAQLPAVLVDQVLDATDEERAAAAGELLDRTGSFLESAGVLRPSASVLDLDHHRLMALAAVYGTGWRLAPRAHERQLMPQRPGDDQPSQPQPQSEPSPKPDPDPSRPDPARVEWRSGFLSPPRRPPVEHKEQ
jgi:hypothetical protein